MTKAQSIALYEAKEEMNRATQRMRHTPAIHMTAALDRLEAARAALETVVHSLLDL